MSKQIQSRPPGRRALHSWSKTRFGAVLLGLFGVLAPAIVSTSAQRNPQTNDANVSAARNSALVAATNEVLKETSEIRKLPILRPVKSSVQSRDQIRKMIIDNLDHETTPAELHATEVTLKRLGLAPADFQFRPLIIRLLTEQVAGYYDPKLREFHLADWIDVDGQKAVMAHELTHALQDQNFDLRRFEHWPKGDSDAELATHALIEGDATQAMLLYVTKSPARVIALMKSMTETPGMTSEELDKAPRAVRESLLFPYQEGLNWTQTLYRYGGWAEVSQAFKTLPQSTEQILHPEKYFARDAPVKVKLPDLTRSLPGRAGSQSRRPGAPLGSSWRLIDSDVNGEWSFYLILDQFLKSPTESQQASAGWGGDSYEVYESRDGEVLYVSLSTWDTAKDAREFFNAYVKRTELRYPGTRSSATVDASTTESFAPAGGAVRIEISGSRVLVFEGLSKAVSLRPLKDALGWVN